MTKILIVGELNPYGSDPQFALYHLPREASGNRLRRILGLRDSTYAALDKVNLCTGKWSITEARWHARQSLALADHIVCLGDKVRHAFGYSGHDFFTHEVVTIGDRAVRLYFLPHPSGRNTIWNVPGAAPKARALLAAHVPGVPWGETGTEEERASMLLRGRI